jgi:hypothetical protein
MGQCQVTLADLKLKYGVRGISLAVEQLIRCCPPFLNDTEIAVKLGEMMADLEAVLAHDPFPGRV